MRIAISLLCLMTCCYGQIAHAASSRAEVRVPAVGCAADGQMGYIKARKLGKSIAVQIDAKTAQELAYYQAENAPGVLAPRGWHCFGAYGSGRATLFVLPQPIKKTERLTTNWAAMNGYAVVVHYASGETSGRFNVARFIARAFPQEKAYVEKVMAEGLEPTNTFPFGAFVSDKIIFQDNERVEYLTPGNSEGLGTLGWLKPNANPIYGIARLYKPSYDMLDVDMRLPVDLIHLVPAIKNYARQWNLSRL